MNSNDWKTMLATIAPGLATMLGGPLAGMAVSAIGDKLLGKKTATESEVAAAITGMSPADMVKLKEVEADVTKALSDAGVKLAQIDQEDRASAREREVKLNDWTPRILAVTIIAAWMGVNWLTFHVVLDANMATIAARVLGTMDSALMLVLYYYFGSSASSKAKDATIQKIAEEP